MAFRDYCAELTGTIPNLSFPLAMKLVNRAWGDIRDLRLWSFLVGNGDIVTPALINTGTVNVVSNSTTVTLSSAANAVISAALVADPLLASTSLGQGRQIRIGNTGTSLGNTTSNSPLYNITAYNSLALTLTLDRRYTGSTATLQPYQLYKAYYSPPSPDFVRYFTVTNMRAGYTIRGKKLYYKQESLNAVDPQRGSMGDSYILAAFRVDSTGRPVHEWYPHPTNLSTYNCIYQRRGTDLSDTVDLPATMPASLLMAKAFMHAASWAQANLSKYSELQQTNWILFGQDRKAEFRDTLIQAMKQDDEIFPQTPFPQNGSFDYPLGGEFVQGHDVSTLIGG